MGKEKDKNIMISVQQQKQLEKYVEEFQSYATEGADPKALHALVPEFYYFVGGCKAQIEKTLKQKENLQEEEINVAEGLLKNLNSLQSSLLETSRQLGISLETNGHTVTANQKTHEIRINFEQCHQDSLKNIVIQAIKDTLNVEAPLANSRYTVGVEPDNTIVVHVIHDQQEGESSD